MVATRGLGWSLGRALRLPNRVARAAGRIEKLSQPYGFMRNLGRALKGKSVQTKGMRAATLRGRQGRLSAFLARKGATRQLAVRRGLKLGAGAAAAGGAGFGYTKYRQKNPRYQYPGPSIS